MKLHCTRTLSGFCSECGKHLSEGEKKYRILVVVVSVVCGLIVFSVGASLLSGLDLNVWLGFNIWLWTASPIILYEANKKEEIMK